jgi:hypothetical protein
MPSTHTYQELLRINEWIQKNADTWYLHCTTRTVQESKLFPTPAYMVLSYLQSYYRYPALFRKLADVATPEDLGDRMRETGTKGNIINLDCIPQFYLGGRQMLIDMGMLKPTDGIDDLVFLQDFARRLNLAYHRNHQHNLAYDGGLRAQLIPERRVQVFEADAIAMKPGDRLHHALQKFLATANQYSFLSHCENRLAIHNHGPYRCGPAHEMLVRGFVDLAEGDLSWMDGIASEVTHNNLTLPVIVKDTHFHIVDDWASFESAPTYDHDNVVAVGLYTSDHLSEGEIPVAMDNAATLADFLEHEEQILHNATRELWRATARWTRDQMLDAGGLIYFSVAKDLFHVAGIYDQDDWFTVDERAQRFKPFLNDEYGRDFLAELLGLLTLPSQQRNPYTMSKHSDGPSSMWSHVPYSVLVDDEWTSTTGDIRPGTTTLPAKASTWTTTRGKLSLDEYNTLCREFTPQICQAPWRFLDDAWVKTHHDTPLADDLYRIDQRHSRTLEGRGAGVTREDIERIRAAAATPEPVGLPGE